MRLRFSEVFDKKPDGSITPIRPIRIGGVTLGPGVIFSKGVSFSGVDISNYDGMDIEANEIGGIIEIRGFYSNNG